MGRRRSVAIAGPAAALLAVTAVVAGAQAQGPTAYCEGDGGPMGRATDAEHSVLVGDPPLPRGVQSSRISVGGIETRVQQAGDRRAREAVVFVHGHPGSSRDWDDLVASNGSFARTIAFDITGYGSSHKARNRFQSTEGAARFIGAALDRLGVDRAVVGVHDFGGVWAMEWARRNPDRLLGAVIVNSGVFINYIPHPNAWLWATPGAGEADMAATTRETFRESIQARNPGPLPERFLDRMYDDYDRATRCAALRYYRSGFENPGRGREQAAVLRKRRRPALVIWGRDDPYSPREHAERQRQAFPDARIEILPGSGHWTLVDRAKRVRELVVPFLRPRLGVRKPRLAAGRRRVRVAVRATGVLPALRVRARLRAVDRRGRTAGVIGMTPRAVTVRGSRTVTIRLSRRLRARAYQLVVSARGLGAQRSRVRARRG